MKRLIAGAASAALIGSGLALAPAVIASPESAVVQSAEATVLTPGTWGRTTYYYNAYYTCWNNREVWWTYTYKLRWNGYQWVNTLYENRTYYRTDYRGYAVWCGWA